MRLVVSVLAMLVLAACSSSKFVVRQVAKPKEAGSVAALADLVKNSDNGVLVIFVHGVADHCPGYALNEDVGWLNSPIVTLLGLVSESSNTPPSGMNPLWRRDPAHGGGPIDDGDPSWFAIAHSNYHLRSDESKKVMAVELTWSGLTQWLKAKQLGFDLTTPIVPAPSPQPPKLRDEGQLLTCLKAHMAEDDQKRASLNRALKEDVLDRSLADALLYVGSNGSKINDAMGETICRALTGNFRQDACAWSEAKDAITKKPRSVVFVTHSLGSRIVYDTLLELAGQKLRTRAGEIAESNNASGSSGNADADAAAKREVALAIGEDSSAAYMMANQLPLLGLVYIPPEYRNENQTHPFLKLTSAAPLMEPQAIGARSESLETRVARAAAAQGMVSSPATLSAAEKNIARIDCRQYSLLCFAQYIAAKKNEAKAKGVNPAAATTFHIVAFSDTNDLLTWALPVPYADSSVYLDMDFANVFVQNSTRWAGVVENPATAHSGYFTNEAVRRVIVCGADGKTLRSPCH